MNKKIITGLIVLLGVIAVLGLMNNSEAGVQLIKKHSMKKHQWGWGSWKADLKKRLDPGCPPSDAYEEQCEGAGGVTCGENKIGNDVCCSSSDDCNDKKVEFWGHSKEWKQCKTDSIILTGSCPE